uniref:Uncharacterized protein n=1 Tax=Ignisphaera aggregans TaxID=334771 RepID=A0A7C5XGK1_9CREN
MKVYDAITLIIKAVNDQVSNCLRYNLNCLDPPCITSGQLDSYGLKSYSSKASFWRAIESIVSKYNGVVVFRGRFGVFKLLIVHSIEESYRIENTSIYVDSLDCEYVNCSIVPKTHSLRIYLEGSYSDRVIFRMNIITLLKLAISENPYFRECLERFSEEPFKESNIIHIASCSLGVLSKHRIIYDILFNRYPKNIIEVLRHIPVLRNILIPSHTIKGEDS